MMLGDLPPSSWWTRFTVSAAFLATRMPARVEPVKLIMSMSGMLGERGADAGAVALDEVEDARRHAGRVHHLGEDRGRARRFSLGLRIMVQPAAIAGATLATIWFIGQFHGVISATTPIGS